MSKQHFYKLLQNYRARYAVLIEKQAAFGNAFIPTHMKLDLDEAAQGINDTKHKLRSLGEDVEDLLSDPEYEEDNQTQPAASKSPAAKSSGDTYVYSGNFTNAIINNNSSLKDVTQQISVLPSNTLQQDAVKQLATELANQLKQAEQQGQEAIVAKTSKHLENLLKEYQKSQPDPDELETRIDSILKFTNQLQPYVPSLPATAEKLKLALLAS